MERTTTIEQVVFSHGKESGPWGSKIRAMAEVARGRGFDVASLDYRGMEPGERVRVLLAHLARLRRPPVLVGSSMGGHVAAAAAAETGVAGLFLLAPAFYMPGYEAATPAPSAAPLEIVHGWRDDVVPVEHSVRYAREAGATLHVLESGHRLTDGIDTICGLFGLFLDAYRPAPA
jgi:pimeloyl-ACP methyl ester carboxylesterase